MSSKQKQLSHPLQQLLKKLLLTISKGEKSIERQRQKLATLEQFEPFAAFQRIDRNNDGLISSVEIVRFLRDNAVEEATEADCYYIARYFDSDEDGCLNYQDFLQILMPCDDSNLRAQVAQRPNYPVNDSDYLGADVEFELTMLFEKEIAFNRVAENIKQTMAASKQFDYNQAFNSVDDWNYGFVDKKNLKSFFRKHGHLASNEEVMAIIRRMDMDADARLCKSEFIEGIKPEEPYSKMMKRNNIAERQLSQKRSTSTHHGHQRSNNSPYLGSKNQLKLTQDQEDVIRTQAMDRSIRNLGPSSSPLKMRPNFREDLGGLQFATPKSRHYKNSSASFCSRTPRSQKRSEKASASLRRSVLVSQKKKTPAAAAVNGTCKSSIRCSSRKLPPASSKSGTNEARKKARAASTAKSAALRTVSTINNKKSSSKPCNELRRTYNYKAKKDANYEPITREFLLRQAMEKSQNQSLDSISSPESKVDSHHFRKQSLLDISKEENDYSKDQSYYGGRVESVQHNTAQQKHVSNCYDQNEASKAYSQLQHSPLRLRPDNDKSRLSSASPDRSQSSAYQQYKNNRDENNESPCLSNFSDLRIKQKVKQQQPEKIQTHNNMYQERQQQSDHRAWSRLSAKETERFIEHLISHINFEKDLEEAKIELSLKEDFNAINGFSLLDTSGKGYVSAKELRENLERLGVRCTIDEVNLILQRYSLADNGRLKFSEYKEAVKPSDQHFAELFEGKNRSHAIQRSLSNNNMDKRTIEKFIKLWDIIIENENHAEAVRQKLNRNQAFNIDDAFRTCNISQNGRITASELKQLMYEQGVYVSSDDLQLLINRFKVSNQSNQISYAEFAEELMTKYPYNY